MLVTHYQRRPQAGQVSVERVFAAVRAKMPAGIQCRVLISRFVSRGTLRRIYNMVEAAFHQADINHITGDVHFLALLLRKKKTVLTIMDCVSLERLTGLRRALLKAFWYTFPIRRSRVVVVISESTKTELVRHLHCDPSKVYVIPACLDPEFRAEPREFDAGLTHVLQVGTSANKNVVRVAEALAEVPCVWRIIGTLTGEQERTIRDLGLSYRALGFLDSEGVRAAYRESDMVVFASTYEGFGLPIIEANAIGRPVVTSNILSMPEVAGDAACLVDPFDPASIRAGVRRVIDDADYRARLVANGFRNAKRFSAETVAGEYAKIYRELAGGSKPGGAARE